MDVKWIKIVPDIFEDEKILLIEDMPKSDSIIVLWFKLLCLAGKQNNGGVFMMNDRTPYTDKMLATIFRRPLNTVRIALETFEKFGMIEIIDGTITITNWEKYQNTDRMAEIREYNKLAQQKSREKRKLLKNTSQEDVNVNDNVIDNVNDNANDDVNDMSMTCQACHETDKNKNKNKNKNNYISIIDTYHETCVSFPKVTVLSDKRKQAIKARLATYSIEQFQEMFRKAEASDFLKGKNNRDWRANFDWLMKDSNFAKVLDGNYDNSTSYGNTEENNTGSFETDDFFEAALKRSYGK